MNGIRLNIESDELSDVIAAVEALGDEMDGRNVAAVAGRSMQQTIKEHFEDLSRDSLHHRSADSLGAPRTGFYEQAAEATQSPEVEGEGVSVSILLAGLAQRYFGGNIEASAGHLLTIPARTEAYGHRAREFSNLRLIMFPSGAGALVERDATVLRGGKRGKHKLAGSLGGQRKGDEIGGGLFFWLVKQVHQDPDPSVLPTDEAILDPALNSVREDIERRWSAS